MVTIVCALTGVGLYFYHERANSSPISLAKRLPEGVATAVFFDVAALREGRLLDLIAAAEMDQESEYREFVAGTGFDYSRDLDAVLAGFYDMDTFLLLKGRFDWRRLFRYAVDSGGTCYNGMCRLHGSTDQREISFFAVTPHVMGLAISPDPWAAYMLAPGRSRPVDGDIPEAPVWLQVPGPVLDRSSWLPTGARSFVSALVEADRISLAFAPSGAGFEARLEADLGSDTQASQVAAQLTSLTELLDSLIRREEQEPNPADLSGVLTAGSFESYGAQVRGRWPIRREFLEALASGAE